MQKLKVKLIALRADPCAMKEKKKPQEKYSFSTYRLRFSKIRIIYCALDYTVFIDVMYSL